MKKRLKRIHVNRNTLNSNRKHGRFDPAVTVRYSKGTEHGHVVVIYDDEGNEVARVIHSEKPLSCGAKVWIETRQSVAIMTLVWDDKGDCTECRWNKQSGHRPDCSLRGEAK